MPTASADATVIIVHYRGVVDTAALLDRLPAGMGIVVVDNSGRPGRLAAGLGAARVPRLRLVDPGANVGFAAGANLGARHATRNYLIFLNPDVCPEPAALDALIASMAGDSSLAAVAPATYDGVRRGGGGRQPTPRTALQFLAGPLVPGDRRIWLSPAHRARYEVEWLSGACLVVRRDAFLTVGGFDERYPLYNEDMALGRRLRAAGWRLVLDATVDVPHRGGGSLAGMPRPLWRHRGGALGRYACESGGPATQWLLAAGFLERAVGALIVGQGRQRAREWLAYAAGVARAAQPALGPAVEDEEAPV